VLDPIRYVFEQEHFRTGDTFTSSSYKN
jgi:hypothetical protein